ncbi:hypothetical protein LAZ29_12165 [Cereibacter sphaeroides]|uniref:hypothetical protein n=1 Tax=Cereibacter sphaeroides TaxID=1063 RepID=UPI001F46545F|nr:hypothetical protein [Cereibacter sphaeroides]MCE6951682.1 hypothetical protein [Cereibacter sphaeroides]
MSVVRFPLPFEFQLPSGDLIEVCLVCGTVIARVWPLDGFAQIIAEDEDERAVRTQAERIITNALAAAPVDASGHISDHNVVSLQKREVA